MSCAARACRTLAPALLLLLARTALPAQDADTSRWYFSRPDNSAPNPYRAMLNPFVLPDGRTIGWTAGIDVDTDGSSIWIFERCGGNTCAGSSVRLEAISPSMATTLSREISFLAIVADSPGFD